MHRIILVIFINKYISAGIVVLYMQFLIQKLPLFVLPVLERRCS
jgi:hypothetical protein